MDQWFAKFLDGSLGNRTDKPDSLPESVSVSGMSGQCSRGAGGNSPMQIEGQNQVQAIQPGDHVYWERGDLSFQAAEVDFLHTDATDVRWLFVTQANGDQITLNEKVILRWTEKGRL